MTPDFGTAIRGVYTGQMSDPKEAMQDLKDRSDKERERAIKAAQVKVAVDALIEQESSRRWMTRRGCGSIRQRTCPRFLPAINLSKLSLHRASRADASISTDVFATIIRRFRAIPGGMPGGRE